MLINIIGFGSFLYLISSYLGCSPRNKTRINPACLSIGGCPYNQLDKDPKMIPMSGSICRSPSPGNYKNEFVYFFNDTC